MWVTLVMVGPSPVPSTLRLKHIWAAPETLDYGAGVAGPLPFSQLRRLKCPGTTWPGPRDHKWHRELEEGI